MNAMDSVKVQTWCAWCGPAMVVTYLFFWIILGHNYPPPSPAYSGAELVANYYGKYRNHILLGMACCAASGMLYLPWTVQLTVQMMRREKVPVLSYLQLTGGLLTAWVLVMCPAMWALCALHPNALNPDITKTLHLTSWYIYDMTYMITTLQLFGCGFFAILDKAKPAIYPAWAGWIAVVVGIGFIPLTLIPYFDQGIFAINGYWCFHIVFASWGVWFTSFTVYMMKDVRKLWIPAAPGLGQAISHKGFE